MIHKLRRLFRTRLWDILVTALGLLSFSVYILHQSRQDLVGKGDITMVTSKEKAKAGPVISPKRRNGNRTVQWNSLHEYLEELEVQLTKSRHNLEKSILVAGEPGVIGRDLPLYQRAFKNRGFDVKVKNPFNNLPGFSSPLVTDHFSDTLARGTYFALKTFSLSDERPKNIGSNWTVFLCFSYGSGQEAGCWDEGDLSNLKSGQKVNRVPGMRNVLWRKDAFCHSTNEARGVPAIRRNPVSPPCWVLPQQIDQFLGVADALGTDVRWLFKSPSPGGTKQILHPTKDSDFFKIKQYYTTRAIVQQYFPNPLLLHGHVPISIQLYALVTSITPLRVFLHTKGIVQYRFNYAGEFRKIPDKPISLSMLYEILNAEFGSKTDELVKERIEAVVTKVFLISERFISLSAWNIREHSEEMQGCRHCFQLFSLDVILNSTFHPTVIEVNGQPTLPKDLSLSQEIIDDTVSILLADGGTARELERELQNVDFKLGFKGFNCRSTHVLCLSSADLEYLIITRQQTRVKGEYRLIYPSSLGYEYSTVVQDLYRFPLRGLLPFDHVRHRQFAHRFIHSSNDLHDLLTTLQQFSDDHGSKDDDLKNLSSSHSNLRPRKSKITAEVNQTVVNRSSSAEWGDGFYPQLPCSNDEATMPLLSAIYTHPPLNLTPTFDPENTDYYTNVPHDILSVRVWGVAMSCSCEARAFNKFGMSILGHQRWSQRYDETPIVCSLKQNCKLKFLETEDCGLQREVDIKWDDVDRTTSPLCQTGSDIQGRWLIPCESCSSSDSCNWQQAKWQPYSCQYAKITFQDAQNCLAGKKILFIGDSTNRGIMYYLMQRINGSLHQWDKTHQIKSYSNLNENRTVATFAYYPQFWLPSDDRPAFDATVHDIVQHSQPLEDGSNTILVVGGVHWLAPQHLKLMEDALMREGLTNILRVMKGLGAGFHQAVDGVHNLSLADHISLFHHNQELSNFASSLGYRVVDTFNMTMARFTEFRPGTCSCHFHEVVEDGQYLTDALSHLELQEDPKPEVFPNQPHNDWDVPLSYRVLGNINAMYSEMLLSSICDIS
ncbi:putative cadherin-like and PC-esterase domain-containing protein 1 isoform X2 [Apostichopus japonicus]|uniref:Putative cadherin-like and PC-esterase domain-containing protein 1 isoform X2 n=1 Tax=Stichopus japonicus TaxID=307972 RepID=A0A2G8LEX6_STIJA|nr:putative cadherin-like and PC-esterase domain-containing protein 1 isoform X2 [Apostichopus japonicus]